MSDYHDHNPDDLLERYLDGLLTGDERVDFERRLELDPSLAAACEQQRQLEQLLHANFSPPDRTAETIASLRGSLGGPAPETPEKKHSLPSLQDSRPSRRRVWIMSASVVAALLMWAMVLTQPQRRPNVTPFFEQRPLRELYHEVVRQGFRPYYFCEDQERFAQTFRKRQNVSLVLAVTPDDRRMVGLSYIGGLSRDTTAMLAYVQEQPVVVFVDRKEFDNRPLMSKPDAAANAVHIHRSELGELVLYEVSPFDAAKMTPYLELPSTP